MNKFKLFLFQAYFFIRVSNEVTSIPDTFLAKSDVEKTWKPYKLSTKIQRERSERFGKFSATPTYLKYEISEEGGIQLIKPLFSGIDYARFDIVIRYDMNRLLYWFWSIFPVLLIVNGHLQAKVYYILLLLNSCKDFVPCHETAEWGTIFKGFWNRKKTAGRIHYWFTEEFVARELTPMIMVNREDVEKRELQNMTEHFNQLINKNDNNYGEALRQYLDQKLREGKLHLGDRAEDQEG